MATGGASASDQSRQLRANAQRARAARQAGAPVKRGQSATALTRQAKAWEAGSVGEARAQRKLDLLTKYGHTTLHDVLLEPGKAWNLDHLVIGPAGVFFIDAKNWRGTITVTRGRVVRRWHAGPKTGWQTQDMSHEVTKVRGMAAHAAARLGVPVRPVICLAGAKSRHYIGTGPSGEETIAGLVLVSVDRVMPWLRDAPAVLAPPAVTATATLARRTFPYATPPPQAAAWTQGFRD